MIEYRNVPLVKLVCDALTREVDNALRSQGLTGSQIQLLLKLSETDGGSLSFKELEARLNVSQAAVVGLIHRLEQKKFITILNDVYDRRVKHAQITALGTAKCDEAHEHMDAIECRLTKDFKDTEVKQLYNLLQKSYAALK